jgi:hypothetical protein
VSFCCFVVLSFCCFVVLLFCRFVSGKRVVAWLVAQRGGDEEFIFSLAPSRFAQRAVNDARDCDSSDMTGMIV